MQTIELEKDLKDFAARELYELTWLKNHYPIHSEIATACWRESMREYGHTVEDNRIMLRTHKWVSMPIELSDEEILKGWSGNVIGSSFALQNSMYKVYDIMMERHEKYLQSQASETIDMKRHILKFKDEWNDIRNSDPREIRDKIWEPKTLEQFMKYHENAIQNIDGSSPVLGEPVVYRRALDRFPMRLLELAVANPRAISGGPDAVSVDFNGQYDESYHPSESTLMEIYTALVFDEFAKAKGIKLKDNLKGIIRKGNEALPQGRTIWKTNS